MKKQIESIERYFIRGEKKPTTIELEGEFWIQNKLLLREFQRYQFIQFQSLLSNYMDIISPQPSWYVAGRGTDSYCRPVVWSKTERTAMYFSLASIEESSCLRQMLFPDQRYFQQCLKLPLANALKSIVTFLRYENCVSNLIIVPCI